MLTMQSYLEDNKNTIMAGLAQAETPQQIQDFLSRHLDRMLISCNESCNEEALCAFTAALTAAAKSALSLTDTAGVPRVWRAAGNEGLPDSGSSSRNEAYMSVNRPAAGRLPFLLLLSGGIACLLAALILMLFSLSGLTLLSRLLPVLLLNAAGGTLLFLAGSKITEKRRYEPQGILKAEPTMDPEKIWKYFRLMILTMDQCLKEEASRLKAAEKREPSHSDPITAGREELDLYAGLLEAACSRDGEYALDELSSLRFYLHRHGIEAVDYTREHPEWFEFLPSEENATIRPALTENGKLLKKGLAAVRKDEIS